MIKDNIDIPAMPVIWEGRPSQIKHALAIIGGVALLILFLFGYFSTANKLGAYAWLIGFLVVSLSLIRRVLETACTTIRITEERIIVEKGILNRETFSLELFRIQDVIGEQSLWLRPFGLGRLIINSSDTTIPQLYLSAIPEPFQLRDKLNRAAISLRQQKGIQEVNFGRI